MQYIYNINKVGNLTNNRGVLSRFSSSNYATIDKTTDITNSFEFAFKFTTASDVSTLQVICMGNVDQQGVRIEISGSKFGLLCGANNTWITTTAYQGGTVQANTTYWVKAKFNGSSQYTLDVSTDGSTYNTVVSYTSSTTVTSNFNNYLLGIYSDLTQGIFKGTIDLNECSITIDNNIVWQGVTVEDSVKIQLRHDTAANWTSVNPVLLEGEVGVETDTLKQKVGNGATAWSDLPYSINYDSFDLPIQRYVAQTGTTWDETKLTYNSSIKVFTPTDSTENRTVYPITFNIPSNISIHSYNDSWRIYIPNNTFQSKTDTSFDSCSCQIFAESGQIAQLWYSAGAWRKGTFEGGQVCSSMNSSVNWTIDHRNNYGQTYIYPYNLRTDTNNLNYGFTYNANSGNLTKVVVFVNTGMNFGVSVGDLRLCTLDSSGNILEEYPLFTESTQPQIKLAYNPDNLTVNSSNQLDTTTDLANFITPNTKVIDGQWVSKYLQIANGVTVASDTTYTYDLSSYLPVDNYNYEILYTISASTDATANKSIDLRVSSSILTSNLIATTRVKAVNAVSAFSSGLGIIPIGTNRKIYVTCAKSPNTGGKMEMFRVSGYRRIGTNV